MKTIRASPARDVEFALSRWALALPELARPSVLADVAKHGRHVRAPLREGLDARHEWPVCLGVRAPGRSYIVLIASAVL